MRALAPLLLLVLTSIAAAQQNDSKTRLYENRLTKIESPKPLLGDYPEFFEPIREQTHFEAPPLVVDEGADLDVRAWRFSYNARGIIEMPNKIRSRETAVIMVHPWAIDDSWGWKSPEPNGVADFCVPEKNKLAARHSKEVIDPFLKKLRGRAGLIMYSLPGPADPIRTKVYRSFAKSPTETERKEGTAELKKVLSSFDYRGAALPSEFTLSETQTTQDYFSNFPGLDSGAKFNGEGFWNLPIPVSDSIEVDPDDVVIFDEEGYPPLRDFLKSKGIRHVLLTGYATDMCYCRTTAGYENLSKDFNVFLVADASLATFPANSTPRFAVNASISFASLNQLITQVSWVKLEKEESGK